MSTVVLTLVVVAGSFAVAAWTGGAREPKPATEPPVSHRARGRTPRMATSVGEEGSNPVTVDAVDPRPSVWVRLRAISVLTVITAVCGTAIAVLILGGIAIVSQALESAVN